jgi:hypothetical protein
MGATTGLEFKVLKQNKRRVRMDLSLSQIILNSAVTSLATNSVVGTYEVSVIIYTAQPSSGATVISGGANLVNFEAS